MVKEAKDRAEWFLAYYKPKDDEKACFERISKEMDYLGIPEAEGEGGVAAARPPAPDDGKGHKGAQGAKAAYEKPIELQIRDIHGVQNKAKANLESRLERAHNEVARWQDEVQRVDDLLEERDEIDEKLAKQEKNLGQQACKGRRVQGTAQSERRQQLRQRERGRGT